MGMAGVGEPGNPDGRNGRSLAGRVIHLYRPNSMQTSSSVRDNACMRWCSNAYAVRQRRLSRVPAAGSGPASARCGPASSPTPASRDSALLDAMVLVAAALVALALVAEELVTPAAPP